MSDRLIIVDGYNVILRTKQLEPGPERTMRESREKLVNLLSWAMGAGDAQFIVVFDGAEEGGPGMPSTARVEVRFSKPPDKADDLIRTIVGERIDRVDRITVVTGDLEIARSVRALGADIALSDLFLASVLGPRSHSAEAEPIEKPERLSKADLEEWAKVFRAPRHGELPDTPDDD